MSAQDLVVDRVSKRFGTLPAVQEVSLTIPAGERHVIIGPNGAGKTTLLNLIGGELRPSSGRILLGEVDVTSWPTHRRARAGLARTYQASSLFPELSVREQVRLGVLARSRARWNPIRPLRSYRRLNVDVDAALESWHLGAYASERSARISYGVQRCVEIAAALATAPSILLFDEPTAGLSRSETEQVIALSTALSRDVTVVMIEHDFDVVAAFADRVTVMMNGMIVATDSPEEISANAMVQTLYLGQVDEVVS